MKETKAKREYKKFVKMLMDIERKEIRREVDEILDRQKEESKCTK